MKVRYIKSMVLAAVALLCTTSCEKDLEPYSNADCYLNFIFRDYYYNEAMSIADITSDPSVVESPLIYNFKYSGDITKDTVWIEAQTMGFVTNYDRTFALEQVEVEGVDNAVAGVDYMAFDNPETQKCMVVKAGESSFNVPVVLLRTANLKSKTLTLKVRIKPNENFKNGYDVMQTRVIEFTDRLAKPSAWDANYLDYYLGYYGEVKHQLMIEWTGNSWDDDYINKQIEEDPSYIDYLAQMFQKRLIKENAERVAKGLDVYKEADGTEVDFTPASWY